MQSSLIRLAGRALAFGCALSAVFVWQAAGRPPAARAQSAPQDLVAVSAATFQRDKLAPGSLVALFGAKLATTTATATDTDPNQPGVQLPYSLGGTTVRVGGQLAQLLFVSPQQVNLVMPPTPFFSFANWGFEVLASDGTLSAGQADFAEVAPGVFTANSSGKGLPVGFVLRLRADGTRLNEPLFTVENGVIVPRPLDFGAPGDRLFLTLFTTGLRNAPDPNRDGNLIEQVRVLANGYETAPAFVGAVSPGVEQINLEVPRTFLGLTQLRLAIEVDGLTLTQQELEIPLALPPLGPLAWRAAGLEGRRVNSLLGVEAAMLAGADEGIFRTPFPVNDWRPVNYALPVGPRRATALFAVTNIFPYPGTLLLASLESERSGEVLSAIGETGELWINTPNTIVPVLNGKKVRAFAANATHVFAGGDDLSVARISCCNQPWEQAGGVFAPRVNALAANGARVIAGTAANGLYLSNDNGNLWAQQNSGVPATAEVRALLRAGNTWLAGAATGLYRSTDNGTSWARVSDGVPASAAVNALYAYGNVLLAGTAADGVLSSADGGARWQAVNTGLTNQNVLALGAGGNRLWAGTTAGVFATTIVANVNQPPLAEAQQLTLDEDTTKALTLRGSDADGDALTYTITRGPEHGYLRGTGANLVYVPDDNYFGGDQFSFRANDGKLGSRTATVTLTINPINDPPTIALNGERLLLAGQFSDLTISLSDPDQLFALGPPTVPLKLTATGLPEGARLTTPVGVGFSLDIRRLIWVPATPGTYTINFTVSDDATPPLSASQTATLRVADNPEKGAWTPVNSPIRPPRTDVLTNLFADGNDLYAATYQDGIGTAFGLWRSTDGGANWSEAGSGLQGLAQAFARSGNALFIGTDRGVFRSPAPAAGAAPVWTPVNNGLPEARFVIGLTARDNRLVAATAFDLFLSTNQGASWTRITGTLPVKPPPPDQGFASLSTVSSVVFSGDALFASIVGSFGGILGTGILNPDEVQAGLAAAAAESEADALAAAEPLEGVFRSTDNGATWTPVNSGLGVLLVDNLRLYAVFNLSVSGTTLYATSSFGLFRSANQGARWQLVPTPPPSLFGVPVISTTGLQGAAPPASFKAGGPQAVPDQIGLPFGLLTPLPPVAANGKLYFAPYGRGVYTSREDGSDWLPINLGLDEPSVFRLAGTPTRLYAITGTLGLGGLGGGLGGAQISAGTRIFVRNLPAN